MEQYGVYYFFEHSEGKHTLVLADGKSSHKPAPGLASVMYNPVENAGRRVEQYIETWSLGRRAQSGVLRSRRLWLQEALRQPARAAPKARRLRPRFHGDVRLPV